MRRGARRSTCGRNFATRRTIKVVKLTLNRMCVCGQFMDSSTGVLNWAAIELHLALLDRRCNDLLTLLEGLRVVKRVTIGSAHVVHADRGNGFHSRVDLRGADNKTAAAANTDGADLLFIH